MPNRSYVLSSRFFHVPCSMNTPHSIDQYFYHFLNMYTIYYWGSCTKFYGRALPILAALHAANKTKGTDYEIKEPSEAPPGKGFAVPIVTLENGVTIAQTTAIMEVLGEDLGLGGKTAEDKLYVKQYLLDFTDVFSELMKGKFSEGEGESAVTTDRGHKWFSLLESRLAGGYFLGDYLSVVDMYAHFVFLWVEKKGVDMSKYEALCKWYASIKATDMMKGFVDSGVALIP